MLLSKCSEHRWLRQQQQQQTSQLADAQKHAAQALETAERSRSTAAVVQQQLAELQAVQRTAAKEKARAMSSRQHVADANDIIEGETAADNDSQPLLDDLSSAEVSAATTDNDHETQEDKIDYMPSYNSC